MNQKNIYKCHLAVRGYELDSFNHVNNAVYFNYFEQARWEIIRDAGLLDNFRETGNFLVVIDIHIKYIREIMQFDKLVIETSVKRKDPYLYFNHEMFFEDSKKKVSNAKVKTLILDATRTPVDIPEPFFNY